MLLIRPSLVGEDGLIVWSGLGLKDNPTYNVVYHGKSFGMSFLLL